MYTTELNVRLRHSVLHLHIGSAETPTCIGGTLRCKNGNSSIDSMLLPAFHRHSLLALPCVEATHSRGWSRGHCKLDQENGLPTLLLHSVSSSRNQLTFKEMELHPLGNSIWNQCDQVPFYFVTVSYLSGKKGASAGERMESSTLHPREWSGEPNVPRSNPTERSSTKCLCFMQRHEIQVTAALHAFTIFT